MKNLFIVLSLILLVGLFFRPVLVGKLPIPADTIIGFYHPFRDLYSKNYPRGIPYKNSLITDPVRQQYPWKFLVISLEKNFKLPLWNPYSFSGTPLLGNYQSSSFYPLNVIFLFLPFDKAWTILIVLQTILAGLFLYLYLDYFRIHKVASFFGAFTWAFCGFSIAWLTWNTILQTALWLPLLLLAKEHLLKKCSKKWVLIFLLAECSAIFAGHLQVYFYFFLISNVYLAIRIVQTLYKNNIKKNIWKMVIKKYIPFLVLGGVVFFITFIQWYPALQFILLSARSIDQTNWQNDGWFIPWQHLIQFVAPDFFGNPATLNYWGVWNYGELVGYIGIIPFLMSIYAILFRRDKKTFFFGTLFFLSLIFSLPTFIAKIPYLLHLPFISSAQPTRFLFVTDFSLAVLAGLGFDYFIRYKKNIVYPPMFLGLVLGGLWFFVSYLGKNFILPQNLSVAKHNLILPTIVFLVISVIVFYGFLHKNKMIQIILLTILLLITIFDLLRFSEKFTPFSKKEYLFPSTRAIEFLQKNIGNYRIMSTDSRILPPNFSIMYKLQSIEGYDPLYLKRYGELIAALERGKPDISPPFGFSRIITPHNFESRIIDLLGVRYILSLSDLSSSKLKEVFQEGQTRVYENRNALPRVFFVEKIHEFTYSKDKEKALHQLFDQNFNPRVAAVIEYENPDHVVIKRGTRSEKWSVGKVDIISYSENKIVLAVENTGDGFLVLTDTFYPIWKAKIDDSQIKIYRTDYNFRGIFVPKGKHTIEFYTTLL